MSVTKAVSRIGTIRISTGKSAAGSSRVCTSKVDPSPTVARNPPSSRLPLSPMKIEPGGKLKGRNPSTAPVKAATATVIALLLPGSSSVR